MNRALTPAELVARMESSGRVDDVAKMSIARYTLAYCTLAKSGMPEYEHLGDNDAKELCASMMGGKGGVLTRAMEVMVGQFGFGFPRNARENPRVMQALKDIVHEFPLPAPI